MKNTYNLVSAYIPKYWTITSFLILILCFCLCWGFLVRDLVGLVEEVAPPSLALGVDWRTKHLVFGGDLVRRTVVGVELDRGWGVDEFVEHVVSRFLRRLVRFLLCG